MVLDILSLKRRNINDWLLILAGPMETNNVKLLERGTAFISVVPMYHHLVYYLSWTGSSWTGVALKRVYEIARLRCRARAIKTPHMPEGPINTPCRQLASELRPSDHKRTGTDGCDSSGPSGNRVRASRNTLRPVKGWWAWWQPSYLPSSLIRMRRAD